MAEGTKTYEGLAVPLLGESEIKQQSSAVDVLSITLATTSGGDFLVGQDSAGTERFVVEDGGNVVIVNATAADVLISAKSTATPTGNALQILNSDASKIFHINASGAIRTMALGTLAIAAIASNASASYSVTGVTTDDAIMLIPLKALTTGLGVINAYAQGAARIDAYAQGGSAAANTYAVWAFRTTAN